MAKTTFVQTVTDAQIAKLAAQGFSTTGGTLPETSGVVLSYAVQGNTITFTVEKKPFYVPIGAIQNRVTNLLSED